MDFNAIDLHTELDAASAAGLDALPYGVVALDASGRVSRYNLYEAQLSGLDPTRVIGKNFFTAIAPCMNTPLIADQFRMAELQGARLDDTIDYVLAFKSGMLPSKVRMLYNPTSPSRYLLIRRASEAA